MPVFARKNLTSGEDESKYLLVFVNAGNYFGNLKIVFLISLKINEVNMATNPKKRMEDYERIANAVKDLPPDTEFGGITVEDFLAQVGKSRDTRVRIADANNKVTEEEDNRDDTDKETTRQRNLFVNGMKGHKDFGEDCATWEKAGFVRKSERQSGLTKKKKNDEDK